MADDVTERHMDLSWMMNFSTATDLQKGDCGLRMHFDRAQRNNG